MDSHPYFVADDRGAYVASHDGNPPLWLDDSKPAKQLHVCSLIDAIVIRLSFARRNRRLQVRKCGLNYHKRRGWNASK